MPKYNADLVDNILTRTSNEIKSIFDVITEFYNKDKDKDKDNNKNITEKDFQNQILDSFEEMNKRTLTSLIDEYKKDGYLNMNKYILLCADMIDRTYNAYSVRFVICYLYTYLY